MKSFFFHRIQISRDCFLIRKNAERPGWSACLNHATGGVSSDSRKCRPKKGIPSIYGLILVNIVCMSAFDFFPAEERGLSRMSWLESRHSFSFGSWYNPERPGFGLLRVLNDDVLAPGAGFDAIRTIIWKSFQYRSKADSNTGTAWVIMD